MPWAIVYGVPYELFWHLNPTKMKPFKVAFEKKQELQNQYAWMFNQYTRMAIGNCMNGKKCKYPKEPMDFYGTSQKKLSPEESFLNWIEAYNASLDAKQE